jgi:hypothetical protein
MLTLTLPANESFFNEETSEFISVQSRTIRLEHSLLSLSKWESIWCKPFLGPEEKTREETKDYLRCMIIDHNVPDYIVDLFSKEQIDEINKYIDSKMTATTFAEFHKTTGRSEIITAELIYYWMVSMNIPFECQKWHLNRLLTLIRVCSIKNTPPKKMPRNAILSRNKALNEARKKKLNTKG